MGLKEYKAKRNFSRTREPVGQVTASRGSERLFVVQKHAATRLHYDFRLEMEGVLKSWAVPKGFPTQRGDRRLAIEVEDHPLDYAGFEGTIPPGNYGAGTVMVWDTGNYQVLGSEPLQALRSGKLHLILKGKKLKGEWTLVRTRRDDVGKTQWLLMKTGSDAQPFSARAENQSAVTRRTMEQIANANGQQWQSNRPARQKSQSRAAPNRTRQSDRVLSQRAEIDLSHLPDSRSAFVEPMKALLVEELPKGQQWLYEIKFDGVRALAAKQAGVVQFWSRSAKDLTAKYSQLADGLKGVPASEALLDGEIVAVDAAGRPSFQLLQSFQMPGQKPQLFYYVFDLLSLEGKDLRGLPLLQRKSLARALVQGLPDLIRFSDGLPADPERVIRQMQRRGLEGLVAKLKESKYESGRRSGAWLKFKWTNEQEFVIGGYTPPKGARTHFGAILVGYYEAKQLRFAAKVGTGFDQKTLEALHSRFQKLIQPACPFANLPEKAGPAGRGLSRAEMKRCTWLRPELVCQVRFAEWTRDHHLRQPAFLGLRQDKHPNEVVRESPTVLKKVRSLTRVRNH